MEFWRYYRLVRRRRWLIVLGTLAAVLAVAFWNHKAETLYMGRTTVMESKSMQQIGVPLFQSQLMGGAMDVQLQLSNLGNLATSQRVLNNAAATMADLGMKQDPRDILNATAVTPVRDTNILAIEVTLPDAKEAKVAADVVAAEFKKVYAEINTASVKQSREFIQGQIEINRQAMIRAQDALKRYKESNGVVSIDAQLSATVQRMAQAQSQAEQARMSHMSAAARAAQAAKELARLPQSQMASQSVQRNPIWERLSVQLVDLETKKASMISGVDGQSRRLPKHPEVLAIQAQIDDVNRQLTDPDMKEEFIAQTNEGKNPAWQNTLNAWILAKVEEMGTQAQQVASERVARTMHAEMAQLPEKEAKVAELAIDLKATTDTYGLMRSKLDEAKIREKQVGSEVALRTIDPAYVSLVPNKQSLKLMLALMIAPLLGIAVAFLLNYTDNTVKTAGEAEKLLGLPVLTVIPQSRAHSLPRQSCPKVLDVAYQMLTSNLWIANQDGECMSIVVVSAEPDSGRSVTASNLAVSLAREGARVILIDSDLRKPTQHLIFGVDNKAGLTNILSGGATLEDALVPTRVQGLLLVPAGPVPENPVKLLRSPEMKDFVEQIPHLADFVIYDTPAGVAFPDPTLVATMVGSALVVHAAGRVPRGSEAEFKAKMESIGVRLLGVVLNKVKREDSSSYFHYHRSYEGVGMPQLASGKKAIKGAGNDV